MERTGECFDRSFLQKNLTIEFQRREVSQHRVIDCVVELKRREEARKLEEERKRVAAARRAELEQRAEQVVGKAGLPVQLNVGGQIFVTTLDVLTKHESSLLATEVTKAIAERSVDNNDNSPLFLDANGDVFAYILSWLRRGVIPHDLPAYESALLLAEAKFWQLDELLKALSGEPHESTVSGAHGYRVSQTKLLQYMQISRGGVLSLPGANLSGIH